MIDCNFFINFFINKNLIFKGNIIHGFIRLLSVLSFIHNLYMYVHAYRCNKCINTTPRNKNKHPTHRQEKWSEENFAMIVNKIN